MDMGRKIGRYARELTPEQLAELIAMQRNAISLRRPMPLQTRLVREPMYQALLRRKIIVRLAPRPGFDPRRWAGLKITDLGQHVMLARIENELLAAGAIPQPAEVEPD